MKRVITNNELRVGVGRHARNEPESWYVTRYSRNLAHDRADSWWPTMAKAHERANEIAAELKDRYALAAHLTTPPEMEPTC